MENIRNDLLTGNQQHQNHVVYKLGLMNACMDIGKERQNQEDSVLLINHPLNKDFHMLCVADGMGGLLCGEKASRMALLQMIKWFEYLPESYFDNETKILKDIKTLLPKIDDIIRYECNGGGTTLSLVIITKRNAIIINIGDSRVYVENQSKLIQVTSDQSLTWDYYLKGIIKTKDDIRFHKENNLITSHLGCERRKLTIEEEVITTSDYNKILLFSDGVTDCLPDIIIRDIIKNNDGRCLLSEEIVNRAINTTSYSPLLNKDEYYLQINGGKDNATSAVYLKTV